MSGNTNALADQQAELMREVSRTMMNNAQANYTKTVDLLKTNSLLTQRQNEMTYERYAKIDSLTNEIKETEVKGDTYARRVEYAVDDTLYYEKHIRFFRRTALLLSFAVIYMLLLSLFERKYDKPMRYIVAMVVTIAIYFLRVMIMIVAYTIQRVKKK